ncbi:MAG: recombinase family protein [Clostridia bacterium]|nr:recombinase family protein [Clostridia bacterium]
MLKVTKIEPTINMLTHLPKYAAAKRRTAGYARVSTDSDEQFTSYEAQVDYYTKYIERNPDWEFVKVYADEGRTAVNTKRRDGFNQMVEDALNGKIDLIITKSVSRFARNTVDSLVTIRKLKDAGVECYFEKENIYTFDSKCELMLTIMSSIAQEESRSISENVTWGHRKRFADGKVSMSYKQFLGYEKGEDGRPRIVEKEAETVRYIYRLFLDGKTPSGICRRLEEEQIKSPTGKDKWSTTTVRHILTNEKYKGDALLQKSFTVDFLQKKVKKNEGEIPQYYVEDSHPAIICPEEWERVQVEIERRKGLGLNYSGDNRFQSKLICEDCGGVYGPKVWHSTDKYKRQIWQCRKKFSGDSVCGTPTLSTETIQSLFIRAYNKAMADKIRLEEDTRLVMSLWSDYTVIDRKIRHTKCELDMTAEAIRAAIHANASIALPQDEYNEKYIKLEEKYTSIMSRLERLKESRKQQESKVKALELFLNTALNSDSVLEEWNETAWSVMIDTAVVNNDRSITFKFYNGTEITESLN